MVHYIYLRANIVGKSITPPTAMDQILGLASGKGLYYSQNMLLPYSFANMN